MDDSVYTVTFRCRQDHTAETCTCNCHPLLTRRRHRNADPQVFRIKSHNVVEYEGELLSSPSSSSDELSRENGRADPGLNERTTFDRVQAIKQAAIDFPLHSRPQFEARRMWRVRKAAAASFRIQGGVLDDFYLNLLDWGVNDLMAVASASTLLIIKPPLAPEKGDDPSSNETLTVTSRIGITPGGHESSPTGDGRSAAPSDSDFTSVKWSLDGRELAVGTRYGQVEIWDVETGRIKASYMGHTHRVSAIDWYPTLTDRLVSSGSRDKSILTHDLRSAAPVEQRHDRHKQEVCGLKWRPAGGYTFRGTLTQSAIDHEDTAQAHSAQSCDSESDPTEFANSSSSDAILQRDLELAASLPTLTTADNRSRIRAAIENSCLEEGGTQMLRSTAPVLASGGNDNKVYVWELGYNVPLVRLSVHTAAVKALCWAPTERCLLATGGGTNDRTVRIWDVNKGRELATCETESQVCNIFWSPSTLELVSSHGYTLNQVNLWTLRPKPADAAGWYKPLCLNKLATLSGHTARVLYMAGSPDGTRVATAAGDGSLKIWNSFLNSQ